jgi:Beta-galactosidase/beta-glucuronidase
MKIIDLGGKWKMKRTGQEEWIDAKVPGSVYNDLMVNGLLEDPFYRDNEYKTLELSSYDYEYEKTFDVTQEILNSDKILLVCEGLDTLADISINGKQVASTDNMHRTYEFDVKETLFPGSNTIHVLFHSPVEFSKRMHKILPLANSGDAVEGISHIRKAHCMFGWDWGPKLPDMGIWRSITIQGYSYGKIDDILIRQIHASSKVTLDINVDVDILLNSELNIKVEITAPSGKVLQKSSDVKAESASNIVKTSIQLEIDDPQLWWPNNYGAQPLYNVKISLVKDDITIDNRSLRLGLRSMKVRKEKDQWGESFEFVVNRTAIFAMGADYIPEDNILPRCSRERTEKLIKSCIDANFNSIRVWGGGYYPDDYFYDLCDEYGLIVWQDMMFACGIYNLDDAFKENISREAVDNMKRLRHHASLGLLCGNNEQEWGWSSWGWTNNYSAKLKTDYIKQFEILFPEIAAKIAPDTFYWPASPSSGGGFDIPNDDNYGDMHYWGVWHEKQPYTAYRKYFPRFMSEFGIQSFPALKTIETFTLPEDRNIFSYVMESHQKNGTANEKILYYISDNYKYPRDFDSLLFASQLIQAEGIRYGVEHWRRNRGRCMGAVYWQLNDCWPVASWSSIDYFGRYKALHYAAKRFFAPVLASACEDGTKVSLHVTNEAMTPVSGTLEWTLRDTGSGIIKKASIKVTVNALSSKEAVDLDFEADLPTLESKRNTYLEFRFTSDSRVESRGTVLFVKSKHFGFIAPEIKLDVIEADDCFNIKVSSKAFAKFVELDLAQGDAIFSNNYFDLSAGDDIQIKVMKENISKKLTLQEFKEQLKVRSLFDTY